MRCGRKSRGRNPLNFDNRSLQAEEGAASLSFRVATGFAPSQLRENVSYRLEARYFPLGRPTLDAADQSLEEIPELVDSSVGRVKPALHRAPTRLAESSSPA